MSQKSKILFTDGEGPLVLKDLARDIANKRISPIYFDALSMWVAYVSEQPSPKLRPGDTLSLIVPHLLAHNVTDEDLESESERARIAHGVKDYLSSLKSEGWEVRVISTTYTHLWRDVSKRLGISRSEIACTRLNLGVLQEHFGSSGFLQLADQTEQFIDRNEQKIREALNAFRGGLPLEAVFATDPMKKVSYELEHFYFTQLPDLGFLPLKEIPVVNGHRKVEAVFKFANELGFGEYNDIVYVGDSITDDLTLEFIRENRGLAIALNGDEFAIRNANVAVALDDRRNLKPLLDAWANAGMKGVQSFIEGQPKSTSGKERGEVLEGQNMICHKVSIENVHEIARIHRVYREKSLEGAVPII